MTKLNRTVDQYMTAHPYSVGDDQPLSKAALIMREHKIRHLPVLHGGELLGVITDRDVRLIESFPGVNPDAIRVDEAMTPLVYTVEPGADLRKVAAEMAERKVGSAVVMKHERVVGIFTAVDACRALAEVLA